MSARAGEPRGNARREASVPARFMDEGPILFTGATGFLGSHLAAELLRRGRTLDLLVRAADPAHARERLRALWDWHGLPDSARTRARALVADLRTPALGLPPGAGGWTELIHCASDTSFAERRRERVTAVNVDGLARVLDLARAGGCAAVHLVSTAYAAGRREGRIAEPEDGADDALERTRFHNAYEESKARAEALARARCSADGMRLVVYRPAIVCGHSRTGRTMRFNALYYPIRMVLFLRDLRAKEAGAPGRARAGGGADAPEEAQAAARVHLPIRIPAAGQGGVNLIPVDHFVDAFLAIHDASGAAGVYHLVNPRPAPLADLIDYAQRRYRLCGITALAEGAPLGPRNAYEVLFDHYLEAYGPYMRDRRVFSRERAIPLLAARTITCPPFDAAAFDRCMEYAERCGWRDFPAREAPRTQQEAARS